MAKNIICGGERAWDALNRYFKASHSYGEVDADHLWYETGQTWKTSGWTGTVSLVRKKPAHKAGRVTIKWVSSVGRSRVERLHLRYPPEDPSGVLAALRSGG